MVRRVFFSFYYKDDAWRASQVRNMGTVEGDRPISDNDWEEVKRGGDAAIQRWIDNQLSGKSCVVVLVGKETSNRKWVKYEIEKAWNSGKGVVGIYIHNLEDQNKKQSSRGANPFSTFTLTYNNKKIKLSDIVKCYDPQYVSSQYTYRDIKENIADLVEEAIEIRNKYSVPSHNSLK